MAAPIDVLIPVAAKDAGTLPAVVRSIRQYVKHPIGQIVIVAPKRSNLVALCRKLNLRFVNENTVLPIAKKNIRYSSAKWERSGWLFQQFLKMSGDTLCRAENFLVMDADTVLIRPHVFISGNKPVFYCRNWSQPEYFKTYRRLMGSGRAAPVSFVAHYMLFNKAKLARLKRIIEARHHTSWYTAIMRCMDKTKPYAFSEFETYGNFLYSLNPNGMIRRKALNKTIRGSLRRMPPKRLRALAGRYRSISFHKRKGYLRKRVGNR